MVDMFLKLDDAPGESKVTDHTDEIEVFSFSWGLSNPSNYQVGGGSSVGTPSFSDFSIMKAVDKSSNLLALFCAQGKVTSTATFTCLKTIGTGQDAYLTFTFTDFFITSIQQSGSGGGGSAPTESISIAYKKIALDYKPQVDADGTLGDAQHFEYEIPTKAASA